MHTAFFVFNADSSGVPFDANYSMYHVLSILCTCMLQREYCACVRVCQREREREQLKNAAKFSKFRRLLKSIGTTWVRTRSSLSHCDLLYLT